VTRNATLTPSMEYRQGSSGIRSDIHACDQNTLG
jgi:hypothetical protein